ncbi:MAG: hypothetical protein ABEH78_00805 [Haloferacaceae archaeon]
MDLSRRTVLGLLGAATVGGLAGCQSDTSTPTPPDTDTATPTPTDSPTPTATRTATPVESTADPMAWAPTASALGLDTGYSVAVLTPAGITEYDNALSTEVRGILERTIPIPGVGTFRSMDQIVHVANALRIYTGPFDGATVRSALDDNGYASKGTRAGFELYAAAGQAVGIGRRTLVFVQVRRSDITVPAAEAIRASIDAQTGDADTLAASNDDFTAALSAAGGGDTIVARTNTPDIASVEGATAEAFRWRFGADDTSVRAAFVFGDKADPDGVASWASESDDFPGVDPTVETDGRVATATAPVSTGDVTDLSPDWGSRDVSTVPAAQFTFEYDPDAGILTITHESGDAIPAANLYVRGSGFADAEGADQTAAGQWQGSVSGEDSTVVAGDAVVVGVTPAYNIGLVYEGDDQSATLAADQGPDA